MSAERQAELKRHGRAYGEHHLAVNFTAGIEGDEAKECRVKSWPATKRLPSAEFGGGLVSMSGAARNPIIVLRPSGLIGLDIDGPEGFEALERLGVVLPATVEAETGKGAHLYFRPPNGARAPAAVEFAAGGVTDRTEAYFVAPPAIHPSGAVYRFRPGAAPWERDFTTLPPEALAAILRATGKEQARGTPAEVGAPVLEGRREKHLVSMAGAMRWRGATEAVVLAALRAENAARCVPPLPDADLERIAWSICQDRKYAPQAAAEEPAAEEASFARFDLVSFLSDPPPPHDWLLDELLEYGELCWLAGRGKVGKSLVALFLTDALLAGAGTFLARSVGAVDWALYVDAENREATVRRRVHLVGMAPATAALIDYRSVRGVDLGSAAGMASLRAAVDRPGRGLVVLDSLVALHSADEDKAGEVRRFADKLRAVFEPSGVTALGLAHENRAGNLRGSLDWRNSADRVLELVKREDGSRELRIGEIRDGDEGALPAVFRFESDVDGSLRRRLRLEPLTGALRPRRSRAEEVAATIVLLLTGDPTLTRGKIALELGYSRDHGTFRTAWRQAERVLSEDGAKLPGQS